MKLWRCKALQDDLYKRSADHRNTCNITSNSLLEFERAALEPDPPRSAFDLYPPRPALADHEIAQFRLPGSIRSTTFVRMRRAVRLFENLHFLSSLRIHGIHLTRPVASAASSAAVAAPLRTQVWLPIRRSHQIRISIPEERRVATVAECRRCSYWMDQVKRRTDVKIRSLNLIMIRRRASSTGGRSPLWRAVSTVAGVVHGGGRRPLPPVVNQSSSVEDFLTSRRRRPLCNHHLV